MTRQLLCAWCLEAQCHANLSVVDSVTWGRDKCAPCGQTRYICGYIKQDKPSAEGTKTEGMHIRTILQNW